VVQANVSAAKWEGICPRTELDSHANMVVVGKNAFVFEMTGRTCNVKPFSDELGIAESVPIVHAAIAYDCPYTFKTFILLVRNALYMPSMSCNLIPPFIMRERGVIVNDTPKIHCSEPNEDDHCIRFGDADLRIPLQLHGVFSYFHTRLPNSEELFSCDKIFLTPDGTEWNPHCTSFERNERSMLNYEGEMTSKDRMTNHRMEPIPQDDLFDISSIKSIQNIVDDNLTNAFVGNPGLNIHYDDNSFCDALSVRAEISKISANIGSCNIKDPNEECPLFSEFHALNETSISISSTEASKPTGVTKKFLSKIWKISEQLASSSIDSNTQLCRHNAENTLSRQFSTNDRMLRYRRIQSTIFSDTLFATPKAKSTRKNTCCQLFVSDKGFVAVYPMKSQQEFPEALHWFCKQVGVPTDLVVDSHKAQTSKSVKTFCHQVGTTLKMLEVGTPWSNRAELYIGLLKEAVRKDMRSSNSPMVLWDYCIQRRANIHNLIPRPLFQNNGMTPHSATFGTSGDMSNLCCFDWYDWIYYRDQGSFPENKEKLGRVLGPILNEGNEMAQAILTSKGTIVPRRTIRSLRTEELYSETEKAKRKLFDSLIQSKLGSSMSFPNKPLPDTFIAYEDDSISNESSTPPLVDEDPVLLNGQAAFEKPITDHLIHAEVHLPQGEQIRNAKVLRRATDSEGRVKGHYHQNPLLNTIRYEVEFPDSEVKEYAANTIAENMYAQVDAHGFTHTMVDAILDYRRLDEAISKSDQYIVTKSGQRRMRQSTIGWDLLILWKDGREEWIPLKVMKESNPVEVAEFAEARGISSEPAFEYWVPYTLRRRDRIIASVTSRCKRITHKYGIEIPRTIEEAFALDEKNGDSHWRDAVNREMGNLIVAFDILKEGSKPPPGYTKSSGHLIFDVRMTLERKARWVKDGHKTPEPDWSTYAGVVSRESIRIALTYAALNDLPVCGADIQNAYLQAPSSEKHYVICGPEFGLENVGRIAIIVRALYGGKSAGADYWRHVRKAMDELKFTSCPADPDVWMRPGIRHDGSNYWQYVLLYTDDILAIMEDPETFLRNELSQIFTLKEKSIGPPTQYLGNKVSQVTLENGLKCWSFSSSQYVQNAIKNVEDHLRRNGEKLPTRVKSPWSTNYRPEIEITPELGPIKASYYQSLVGILRWIVELGRVDIGMEVSAMASMMALPRQGHLKQLYHMFAFLKLKHNGVMVFDPTIPELDVSKFPREDWSAAAYGDCSEETPQNAPMPRGNGMMMRAFVDSDHAGDVTTRRSRTGFMIYLNSSPIYFFSKKQTSVETSSFGSEFVAMKQCCEYIRGLRYKLRMMGIPVDGPTYIFGDNQSVLANTSFPHSTLKKKSSSIAFHFVREGVAKDEWRTTYLRTDMNPADMLTKSLPGGEKRNRFTSYVLHYL